VTIFSEAIEPLMKDVGERFSRLEIFLPEMMLAASVVKAIQAELAGSLEHEAPVASRGKVVIGTAYGDIHDIGKNMVALMLEVNGFEVVDLGVGVEPLDFVRRAGELDAQVIGISSLLTTSVPYMEETVRMIKEKPSNSERFKIVVGGGPVTKQTADELGADGYGEDAAEAVTMLSSLLGGE
jgi:methylmalonyl-CoA mutase cobalamin-binding domain/chain